MNAWFASVTKQSSNKKDLGVTMGYDDKFIFYTGEGSQYFSGPFLSMQEFESCIAYLILSHPACQNESIKEMNFFAWIDFVGATLDLSNDEEL